MPDARVIRTLLKLIAFVAVMPCAVLAQEPAHVAGRFEADSIRIGEGIPYILTARYPRELQVLFPDSTYSFAPFEFQSKKYFSTHTTEGISYDSAIYMLTTFEIDSVQRLMLPAYVLEKSDCVAVYADLDSVFLSPRVRSVPDSVSIEKLPLKTNTAYQKVVWLFNYPVLLIAAAVILVLLVVAWFAFGKKIRKYFMLRRLKRNYREFIATFESALGKLGARYSSRSAEEALVLWKEYMEGLEQYPYTKSTSREILRKVSNKDLDSALKTIDRGIYGGFESSLEPYKFLQVYSSQRFQQKEEEVRNG